MRGHLIHTRFLPCPSQIPIAAELRAAIASGVYAAGDRLPEENALIEAYGVARMTARHALGMLRNEGLTWTRKGAGVFVRDFRPIVRNSIARVSERQWGAGRAIWEDETDSRNLVVDSVDVTPEAEAPADVRQVLALTEGEKVTIRKRRFVLDGSPSR
ncbi:GntR family transcriptional regulator [Austwickia chelonae]|uniref:Putative GntR family transcriptional regulator n=1 Tax=Austwickia chelonae NBRC 105200 TaxID=1184607 RepID=K6V6J6_9MICO|nr:GntR family transcriptional regulator [Austwickia chelonae]GAB77858.1 putative GntR family transcriptional regulator [Austwickia chelonae NBRC 105200]